ncbi:MAG: hypothetical protein JXR76_06470 [Deltaproteobacteria bacterium]|nr:hypothetical protein [Deltaproteobacteria bacterium]
MVDDNKLDNYSEQQEQPIVSQSELALELRPRLEKILDAMVDDEVIEFESEKRDLLLAEMTTAAENARHPKAILKAIMYALIKSDNVEEIYGSDPELLVYIEKALSF